jgi:hypothetical protein
MEDQEDGPLVTLFSENRAGLAHGGLRLQPRIEGDGDRSKSGPSCGDLIERIYGFVVTIRKCLKSPVQLYSIPY